MDVIKRDGNVVEFDIKKIKRAIMSAMETDEQDEYKFRLLIESIQTEIDEYYSDYISIENIQDIVENCLMKEGFTKTAKKYILYREERRRVRDKKAESYSNMEEKIKSILDADDIENSNTNVDEYSTSGKNKRVLDYVNKNYALDNLIPKHISELHRKGILYQHDLDNYNVGNHNCADQNSWINIQSNEGTRRIQLKELDKIFNSELKQYSIRPTKKIDILGRNGWTRIKGVTKRPLKSNEQLYIFKTRSGLPLKLTGEHKVPIIRNKKEIVVKAKDIMVGDCLLSSDNTNIEINNDLFLDLVNLSEKENIDIRISKLDKLKAYTKFKYGKSLQSMLNISSEKKALKLLTLKQFKELTKKIEIPYDVYMELRIKHLGSFYEYPLLIPITESLAKLYGYIYADGSVYMNSSQGSYHVVFTNTNKDLIQDYINCFEDVFKRKLKSRKGGNTPCLIVTSGCRLIYSIFKDFAGGGKRDAGNISMPDFILNGNRRIKLAYLSACYDSDGCLTNNKIIYSTSSEKYAEQIMNILESLGYHPHKNIYKAKGTVYYAYQKTGHRKFNNYNISISRQKEINDLYKELNTYKTNYYYERYEDNKTQNFEENKIFKIETNNDNTFVYYLETESHWWIVNDKVVHNCITVDFEDLFENNQGFKTRNTDVRKPNSIMTFFQLVAVVFQLESQCQFGGISSAKIDTEAAPYVRITFEKKFKNALMDCRDYSKEEAERIIYDLKKEDENIIHLGNKRLQELYPIEYKVAKRHTVEETEQACESLYHNLGTLESRAGLICGPLTIEI